HAASVLHDAISALDGVVDIRVTTPPSAAIDKLHLPAVDQRVHEEGEDARNAFAFGEQKVDLGSDKVERADDGVAKTLRQAIGVQHTLEQLLRAGVNPAMLAHRSENELGAVFGEGGVDGIFRVGEVCGFDAGGAAPVDFARRKLDEAFIVAHAGFGDLQVLGEVQPE